MKSYQQRIQHFRGTAYDVGYASGQRLGSQLEQNIVQYQAIRSESSASVQWNLLRTGAIPWLRQLPKRYQDEFAGLAEGAGITLQRVAEWVYFETILTAGCSGFVVYSGGHAWIGRNNDMFVPSMWGYVLIREISGRIPTISLSLEGDIFSPSGLNQDHLWIHHQYLPVSDKPRNTKPHFPSYVFVTEALETCSTIYDVESLLQRFDRDDGMLLLVVDGTTEEAAIFECTCQQALKRRPVDQRLLCTNHPCLLTPDQTSEESQKRYHRLQELVWRHDQAEMDIPSDLIQILADDAIERRDQDFGTVYSVVVCPGTRTLWYTLGGYPAASQGNWQPIPWPWNSTGGRPKM